MLAHASRVTQNAERRAQSAERRAQNAERMAEWHASAAEVGWYFIASAGQNV